MRKNYPETSAVFGSLTDKEVATQVMNLVNNHRSTILSMTSHDDELQSKMWKRLGSMQTWAQNVLSGPEKVTKESLPPEAQKHIGTIEKLLKKKEDPNIVFNQQHKANVTIAGNKATKALVAAGYSKEDAIKIVDSFKEGDAAFVLSAATWGAETWKYSGPERMSMLGMKLGYSKFESQTLTEDLKSIHSKEIDKVMNKSEKKLVTKFTGSWYDGFNAAIWTKKDQIAKGNLDGLGTYKQDYIALETAIEKVPPIKDDLIVYRGVKDKKTAQLFLAQCEEAFNNNKEMNYVAPHSCTPHKSIGKNWAGGGVMCVIKAKTGAYIGASDSGVDFGTGTATGSLSKYASSEMEFLKKSCNYRVLEIDKTQSGIGKTMIYLEEV